jgi:hypothetical protein
MWAFLLASAAQNFSSSHTHFVSIISQLSAKQGSALQSIIGTESAYGLELAMDHIRSYGYFPSHNIKKEIERIVSELTERTADAVFAELERLFDHAGVEVARVAAEHLATGDFYTPTFSYYHL